MAQLQTTELVLEISPSYWDEIWNAYHHSVKITWKSKHVLNPEIMKFGPDEPVYGMSDSLIPTLKHCMETFQTDYWEPIEPDWKLAIYPNMSFPLTRPKAFPLSESWIQSRDQEWQEYLEKRKQAGGHLPEDWFTLILLIDIYNLVDSGGAYWNQGPGVIIGCNRTQLANFCERLEEEYRICDMNYSNFYLRIDCAILASAIEDFLEVRSNLDSALEISFENGFVILKLGDIIHEIQGQGKWASNILVSVSILKYLNPEEIRADPWPNEIRVVGDSVRIWRAQADMVQG